MEEQNPERSLEANEPAEWKYQSGQLTSVDGYQNESSDVVKNHKDFSVAWSASEFISHEKSFSWYLLLGFGTVVMAGIIYLVTREIFSTVIVVIVGIGFGIFGAQKPRVLEYSVAPEGISIGNKHFLYDEFRSFAIINEGAIPSIQLLPHKRFMIPITMYFEPADGDHIIDVLGEYLPLEQHDRDMIDKLISKIHF